MNTNIETFKSGEAFSRPVVINGKCTDPDTKKPMPHWWPSGDICYQTCPSNSQGRDSMGRCVCRTGKNSKDVCFNGRGVKCIDNVCKEKLDNCKKVEKPLDMGYNVRYRGWYDTQNCGFPSDYCRWVGNVYPRNINSNTPRNPENGTRLRHSSGNPMNDGRWACNLYGASGKKTRIDPSKQSQFMPVWTKKRQYSEDEAIKLALEVDKKKEAEFQKMLEEAKNAGISEAKKRADRLRKENALKYKNQRESALRNSVKKAKSIAEQKKREAAERYARQLSDIRRATAEEAKRAAQAAADRAAQTNSKIDILEAEKKKAIADAALQATADAESREAAAREKRMQMRDDLRLKAWDKLHNMDTTVTPPKFDKEMLLNKLNNLNNEIEMLESDIDNKYTDLGSCPDGWKLVKSRNGLNYCSMVDSGNYTSKCNSTSVFKVDDTDENKRNWARNCRVNWLNRKLLDVGESAPLDFDARTEQLSLYNKLKNLLSTKNLLLRQLEGVYNVDTTEVVEKEGHLEKADIIYDKQNSEISKNDDKMSRLESDILTLTRKIEIGENNFREKSFKIFFLKNIFVFLLFSILIGLLLRNKNISMLNAILLESIIGSVLLGIILYNLWIYRNRNPHRFNKSDWVVK